MSPQHANGPLIPGQMACQPVNACNFSNSIWTQTWMKGKALVCLPSESSPAEGGDGWDTNDDETFDDMDDEQQQEIQERMRRLNARSTHKARPPRQPLTKDIGLERQSSFDSDASLASSQSLASDMTSGDAWHHSFLRWHMLPHALHTSITPPPSVVVLIDQQILVLLCSNR